MVMMPIKCRHCYVSIAYQEMTFIEVDKKVDEKRRNRLNVTHIASQRKMGINVQNLRK